MRRSFVSIAVVMGVIAAVGLVNPSWAASKIPKAIARAVADSQRPDADKQRDEHRKPADVVAFAGLKPGDKIADFLPGGGYFTRIFSKTVGAKGHVYAVVPAELLKVRATAADAVNGIAADKAYANTSVTVIPMAEFAAPEPLDMVWTSDNYHDLRLPFLGSADPAVFNKAVFNALKPGGVFLVLDHAAAAGSGERDTATLHRIDPALVKEQVTAAGFVLEAESDVLHNGDDDHTAKVFDGSVKGKTDQFVLRFRKPKVH